VKDLTTPDLTVGVDGRNNDPISAGAILRLPYDPSALKRIRMTWQSTTARESLVPGCFLPVYRPLWLYCSRDGDAGIHDAFAGRDDRTRAKAGEIARAAKAGIAAR